MTEHHINRGILFFLLFVAMLAAIFFFYENKRLDDAYFAEEAKIQVMGERIGRLELEAKAVSVFDITRGRVIYGKEDTVPMPMASLAKTMTVALALSYLEPDQFIYISKNALDQTGDYGLFLYEKWRTEDLSKLTLITSANDGAVALSETDPKFVEKMNAKAKRIGMEHSFFLNPTGLDVNDELEDVPGEAGAFASALDANLLASYGMRTNPEVFRATTQPEITLVSGSGFIHTFKNTDIIIDKIPNLLFSKTGYTNVAGGNLTIVFKNKDEHLMAITVLGSSFEGRFMDMEKIVNTLVD
jgi:serine-type D-Ala-D-Ala carboxypeptidase (penicillin-binding protein 5/6)